jgi:hypothetical protein
MGQLVIEEVGTWFEAVENQEGKYRIRPEGYQTLFVSSHDNWATLTQEKDNRNLLKFE